MTVERKRIAQGVKEKSSFCFHEQKVTVSFFFLQKAVSTFTFSKTISKIK